VISTTTPITRTSAGRSTAGSESPETANDPFEIAPVEPSQDRPVQEEADDADRRIRRKNVPYGIFEKIPTSMF
jgi:hypothetical protein